MRRLYRYLAGPRPHHRRNWRRLWRYCRCGFRWRCPDSIELVPMPYAPKVPPLTPATYRAAVRTPAPMAEKADGPPPARVRARNVRSPLWNSASGRHQTGRAGALAAGQAARVRRAEEARPAPR
ncbi:hypothetical protein I0C86_26160 [Plantactinospora sp. S1510]|uniref:Uncharacterized protein n=1 Tax=Plantactinospora alkalitolerans TaxID=2789879 RepID=A0ABS0H1R8_9ACTN|nr:hypothetical protein [Plantactinospora alkalitolerans]MBF9132407.1 hypothetical protein [Plantactinospora alkalitolerans]